jgi:hypothetical protein
MRPFGWQFEIVQLLACGKCGMKYAGKSSLETLLENSFNAMCQARAYDNEPVVSRFRMLHLPFVVISCASSSDHAT